MATGKHANKPLPAHEQAIKQLAQHYLLGPVLENVSLIPASRNYSRDKVALPANVYCEIQGEARIVYNNALRLSVPQWLGVLSLATLVLALGGARRLPVPSPLSDVAAQIAALYWWRSIKVGELPEAFDLPPETIAWGRLPLEDIVQRLHAEPDSMLLTGHWTLTGDGRIPLLRPGPQASRQSGPSYGSYSPHGQRISHEEIFAQAMVDNAKRALQMQHESALTTTRSGANPNSNAARAKRWLISHYPLLGALLTQFELVEDAQVCQRMDIFIAAIHVGSGEIYINPARQLGLEQSKFVVAHEVLHAGLNHASRRKGRDRYLWNVACDFVINDWLLSMGVGVAPEGGLLFDEALRGWSADDIYLHLAADLRLRRRLCTLRGQDVDLLDDQGERGDTFFTDREAFCRQALMQGLDYHHSAGRGSLPAGLVEEIRTLNQPPIPWQAKLAQWLQERFPLPERKRSYAKPSRRQSVTPDIPRPRFIEPEEDRASRTFGVIIDTSGSMQRDELGKALGAVVSYSQAQAVKQVRLVYCDAAPYDEGYVAIESLVTRVAVRGRGGTVLQAAVNLLESQRDFPKDCPVLIITDGGCESSLTVRHDHAFLVSGQLPFSTRKPVFYMV